ncbi:MAG: hypothetical protein ACYC8V_03985 [Caulobacteraceae bacterium]
MSATHLTVVPETIEADRRAGSLGERIRRLQAEAQDLARGQIGTLCAALSDVGRLAAEICEGGEAYPVGARELCRRLTEEAAFQARTLSVIMDRSGQ